MTPPAAANDNTMRPAEFDARLMSYLPGIRNQARKMVPVELREDLVTDTFIYCLENWRKYREDGGFWNWVCWGMRGIRSNNAQRKSRISEAGEGEEYRNASVPATQHDHADLSLVLAKLSGTRASEALLRRAMGEGLSEIAADMGVSTERVRQISEEERTRLRKVVG